MGDTLSMPFTDMLSTAQAAARLGLSADRVRQLADQGVLVAEWSPLGRLFDPVTVDALTETRRSRGTQLVSPGPLAA
jgi:hypothetical protein